MSRYDHIEEIKKSDAEIDHIEEIEKFNPYHDGLGRFTGAGGGAGGPVVSFTMRTRDPAKQHWADKASAREQERQVKAIESKISEIDRKQDEMIDAGEFLSDKWNKVVRERMALQDELAATKKPVQPKATEKPKPEAQKEPEAPKEFKRPDVQDVREMAKEMGNHKSSISPDDLETMAGDGNWKTRYFQSSNAFKLNRKLRELQDEDDLSSLSPEHRKLVEALDRNMKPSTRDISVMRNVGDSFLRDQLGLQLDIDGKITPAQMKSAEGKVTRCKAYSSTSYDEGENVFQGRNVKLNINCPKGTKMLPSPTGQEAEILLARGTAMQIKGIRMTGEKWGEPQYEIDVEVVVD